MKSIVYVGAEGKYRVRFENEDGSFGGQSELFETPEEAVAHAEKFNFEIDNRIPVVEKETNTETEGDE